MQKLCAPILCLLAGGCAHVYGPRPIESNPSAGAEEATARGCIENGARHDFQWAFDHFNDGMKAAVPVERLAKIWAQQEEDWGPFVSIEGARAQAYNKGWAAIVVCRFTKDFHTISYYFDAEGRVSGSWNNPSAAAAMFIDALGHHHPDWADALSDGQMHDVAPPQRLAAAWDELEAKFGGYERVAQTTNRGLYAMVIASFGHTFATFNVGLDPRGKVTGFRVVAVGEQPKASKSGSSPKQEPQIDFDRHSGRRGTLEVGAATARR